MRGPLAQLTSDLPRTADVAVIGGGILGAATAFAARQAGLRAVVIEACPMLGTLTTPAATGAFRLQFDNPEELALVREGVELYTAFGEVAGLPGYEVGVHQQGYLWVATHSETVARQRTIVAQQRGWGLNDVELLEGDELRQRFPYLAPDVLAARYRRGDGWLDVRKLLMGYARASAAPFVLETTATGFTTEGERVTGVQTSRGTLSVGAVVIAAGPFSAEVARLAGLELPLSFVRRQRVALPEVPEVPPAAPMTIDEETGAHWRPWLRGAHILWTSSTEPAGPPLRDVPTTARFAFRLLNPASDVSVARITPFWGDVWRRNTGHWYTVAGQYSYTPDHKPLLGPTPIAGLYLNCGYSGHGIMGSAGGSRIVVDTITGALPPERNPFRVDRAFAHRELDVL